MAITTLTATALTKETAQVITAGSGTAIDPANSMIVAYPREGKLLIIIQSAHASTAATFAASDYFTAAGQGTLEIAVGNGVTKLVVFLSSDRFKQLDGTLEWTWAALSAGFVQVYTLPY